MSTVAIFGGGMAGLAAAHELVQRGFTVTLYESGGTADLGGKAASQFLAGTGTGGRRDLPGEHGFRFFPGFYRHVIATMFEIPGLSGYTNQDLLPSDRAAIAFNGQPPVTFPRRLPVQPDDVLALVTAMYGNSGFATPQDTLLAAWYRLKYLTSGPARRLGVYESQTWSQYLELDTKPYSTAFKKFERSIPRTMSAMVADVCSARTIGDITMQMMLGYLRPLERPDQVLNGPTSVRWLEPWVQFLTPQLTFVTGTKLNQLVVVGSGSARHVDHAVVQQGGTTSSVTADYYVAALPLERMQDVVTASGIATFDPGIAGLMALNISTATAWMVGAQYFLLTDVPVTAGHVFYPDSAWGLTSISQAQFWNQSGATVDQLYGDGTVRGVLSVDIADWDMVSPRTGTDAKHAGSAAAVLNEVFLQLQDALGAGVLAAANVAHQHLDTHVDFSGAVAVNQTPLLVHPAGSWANRPEARLTNIDNLFLASDYVRTSTQLATMEGANEAARRAVNGILDAAGSSEPECVLWPLTEEVFGAARALDDQRYAQGLPHIMDDTDAAEMVATTIAFLQARLMTDPFSLLT